MEVFSYGKTGKFSRATANSKEERARGLRQKREGWQYPAEPRSHHLSLLCGNHLSNPLSTHGLVADSRTLYHVQAILLAFPQIFWAQSTNSSSSAFSQWYVCI